MVINIYSLPKDKRQPHTLPENHVYIGRAGHGFNGKWGNPFSSGTREENIKSYSTFLWYNILKDEPDENFIADLKELKGKTLVCFCKPKSCHGDILESWVNWLVKQATYD